MSIRIAKEINHKGKKVVEISIVNKHHDELVLSNYGASILAILVQGSNKLKKDITIGFDKIEDYINFSDKNIEYYFGSTIGRYANRISDACFRIEDKLIELSKNEGNNHLHGGFNGLHKAIWDFSINANTNTVIFYYCSKDGEEGYPGNLNIELTFCFNDLGEIILNYKATTDKATPVNLTNHVYFNLNSGQRNILNHTIVLKSKSILQTNNQNIPTGRQINIQNTSYDLNIPKKLENINIMQEGGFDTCYVLNKPENHMDLVAKISEKDNPISIEVYTTEPSIQLYTANSLNGGMIGKSDMYYAKYYGICVETQKFPDSPNHTSFPNTIIFPDDVYNQTTIYKIKKRTN